MPTDKLYLHIFSSQYMYIVVSFKCIPESQLINVHSEGRKKVRLRSVAERNIIRDTLVYTWAQKEAGEGQ